MKKNIYNLLNNGNFHEEKYENINKEELNDLEIKNIERYVKKNSKVRKKNNKVRIGAAVATFMLVIGICNSSFRTEVLASVSNIINKFDPRKNYQSDYVVELGNSYSENGVEIKLDECYRSTHTLRLVYTMNFEKEVPESIKAKERLRETIKAAEGYSYEYVGYENNGVEGCKISINDLDISNLSGINSQVWNCESRDIEIKEKSIKKELIFSIEGSTIKDDLNIKIEYDKILNNSGEEIKGPWVIEYKVKAESAINDVERTNLGRDYGHKFENGAMATIDSYANTNTGIKVFGNEVNGSELPLIRLEGTDNLGNKVLMYPTGGSTKGEFVYGLYDGQTNNRQYLNGAATSLKLRLYAEISEGEAIGDAFVPVGDEFTINIQ